MENEKLLRINELARKKREGALTPAEAEEQALLRSEYVAGFRRSLESTLESITVVDESGNMKKLTRKND
jgi:uncharacterized protein YnzC (UPF0291/DUF896 family)